MNMKYGKELESGNRAYEAPDVGLSGVDALVMLLNEAADEIAWMHRDRMTSDPLAQAVPRVTRLLDKITAATGHETKSPYPPAT